GDVSTAPSPSNGTIGGLFVLIQLECVCSGKFLTQQQEQSWRMRMVSSASFEHSGDAYPRKRKKFSKESHIYGIFGDEEEAEVPDKEFSAKPVGFVQSGSTLDEEED